MKNNYFIFCVLFFLGCQAFAHDIDSKTIQLRTWKVNNTEIAASFMMMKNNVVYIEDDKNQILHFPLVNFSAVDQQFVNQEFNKILKLNAPLSAPKKMTVFNFKKLGTSLFLLLLILMTTYFLAKHNKMRLVTCFLVVGLSSILYSFKTLVTTTDPTVMNAAFAPFASTVATSWDNTYFYVQSKGVPNHTMMVGISNHGWQQQVPVPQCYIGTNHWSIPLNPVLATTPVPVSATHFLKGAIAIAANGVAIFNYHTNTGVDSYLDGQLDIYGGHCGRADDYHYHTAPMHLYTLSQTTTNLPCAYALDGYAVYGSVEPSGSAMTTLDANHGHYGTDGVYHYHGTAAAPYMIGNMVGQVTEDSNLQIIPQASAQPVRNENWTPLSGALITSCALNATSNGYNTAYTLNGTAGYATNFSWSGTTYTFKYVTPTGTTTTTYNGFAQCTVPVLSSPSFILETNSIKIYPNPVKDTFTIDLNETIVPSEITSIAIFGTTGKLVYTTNEYQQSIKMNALSKGIYYVFIRTSKGTITKKIVVE